MVKHVETLLYYDGDLVFIAQEDDTYYIATIVSEDIATNRLWLVFKLTEYNPDIRDYYYYFCRCDYSNTWIIEEGWNPNNIILKNNINEFNLKEFLPTNMLDKLIEEYKNAKTVEDKTIILKNAITLGYDINSIIEEANKNME